MNQNLKKRKLNHNDSTEINQKKPKREPFQSITNVNIERKRHNIESLVDRNLISKIEHNELKSFHEQNLINEQSASSSSILISETQSKRSYVSIENEPGFSSNDSSNLSPIKQIIKNIVDVITNEIIENELESEENNNNGFEFLKTSTPAKKFSNNEINEDLLLICKENNITIENSVESNQEKDLNPEIDPNPVPECFYSNDENESLNKKKSKNKIKFNFKSKLSSTLQTSLPTTSKQATPRKPRQILPHSDKIDFAIAKVLELFTADEIRTGVFGDEKSKTRSKTRVPLDHAKTIIIKNSIGEKFQLEGDNLNEFWLNIRSKLNIRLKDLPKTVKFQKKFEIKIKNDSK